MRNTGGASVGPGLDVQNAKKTLQKLEMWANAQRDGRPAKYRWRPLKLCDGAQMAIFGDFFASCICS